MTGLFHCKEGRQEVEMKPDLSAVSLSGGGQSEARSLSTATIWARAGGSWGGGVVVKWNTNGLNHATLFDLTWLLLETGI